MPDYDDEDYGGRIGGGDFEDLGDPYAADDEDGPNDLQEYNREVYGARGPRELGRGIDPETGGRHRWERNAEGTPEERAAAAIPLIGDGVRADLDRRRAEAEAELNRDYWHRLNEFAPTADDLSVEYGLEDYIAGPGSEWTRDTAEAEGGRGAMATALGDLYEWSRGGFTDTDRAMMDEASRRSSMDARADREAALSSLEARGAGGSGASLAADLAAGEGAASRASSAYTSLLGAAQAREYDAVRDMASLGGAMRDADARERSGREAYNMWDTDYSRGLEGRNTERDNASRESAANANQTVYENRERAVAGATNQYSTDVNSRANAGARADAASGRVAQFAGSLLGGLFGDDDED